jgi:diacylglycerol O-acyltransferase
MSQLSALDATFLYAETAQTPMNLGTVHVLQLPDGYARDFVTDVRALLAKRLHLAPILHRRLIQMPYDLLTPMWVEDDDIDLDHHVRHVMLKRPGNEVELRALIGRLHSQQLDRSRPLWEITLIEGLEGGKWAALVKVHHAGVDGQSGALLNAALMDVVPQPREVVPARSRRRRGRRASELGGAELLAIGVKNLGVQIVGLVRGLPKIVKTLSRQSQVMRASMPSLPSLRGGKDKGGSEGVPRTPFNVSVTNARVWARANLPLADVKRVAKLLRCSVNDVLFAVTGAGLRKYLLDGNELPERSLVAMMPVSTREPGDKEMSNKVSMAPVRLHTELGDPLAQLLAIAADTRSIKTTLSQDRGGIPTDLPVIGMPWLMSGVIDLVGRLNLAESLPLMGNLVISNFVAATTPMYLCGARVESFSPVLILMHGQALGLAMQTYYDTIEIGATGCRRAMPDVGEIVDNMVAAFADLERAAAAHVPVAPVENAKPAAEPRPARAAKRAVAKRSAPVVKKAASGRRVGANRKPRKPAGPAAPDTAGAAGAEAANPKPGGA